MHTARNIIIVFVAIAALAIFLAWWLTRGSSLEFKPVPPPAQPAAVGTTPPAGPPPPRLIVDDQFPGKVVYVTLAELPGGGWVVVHKYDKGQPGAVLGAGYFDSAVRVGAVDLSAVSVAGQSYYAMLHHDNGDQTFVLADDQPWRDAAGEVIMVRFQATNALPERKG